MAKFTNHTDITNIQYLLDYCSQHPDVYNEVANHLNQRFGIVSAEITLLVTYYVNEERRNINNDGK